MCRKNLVAAVGLMAFGAGILVGGSIESVFFRFALGLAAIAGGFCLLNRNPRHK